MRLDLVRGEVAHGGLDEPVLVAQRQVDHWLANGDRNGLNRVVAHALRVPGLLEWLDIARGIRRAARDGVFARFGLPRETPAAPREVAWRRVDLGIRPDAIDADFHPRNRCDTRPRAAGELDWACFDDAMTREEVRNSGWHHQRTDADAVHGRAGIVIGLVIPVRRILLVAIERHAHRLDRCKPLDARHAVPAG